jgi:hypothetical protein
MFCPTHPLIEQVPSCVFSLLHRLVLFLCYLSHVFFFFFFADLLFAVAQDQEAHAHGRDSLSRGGGGRKLSDDEDNHTGSGVQLGVRDKDRGLSKSGSTAAIGGCGNSEGKVAHRKAGI